MVRILRGREGFHRRILDFTTSRAIFNPWAEIKNPVSYSYNGRRISEMTAKEIKKTVHHMKKFTKKAASSRAEARKFLVSAGIYTAQGQLAKAYK